MDTVITAYSIKQAREKQKGLSVLADDYRMRACGTWEDVNGELVFCEYGGVEVKKIGRKYVDAVVDGRAIKMKPCSDTPRIEFYEIWF